VTLGGRELGNLDLAVRGRRVGGKREGESDGGDLRDGQRGSWIGEISGRLGDGMERFRAEQIRRKIVQGR